MAQFTKEEREKFLKQTEEGKKFNGIKTTSENFQEFDFSKVDDPKKAKPMPKQSATTKPKKLVKMTKQAMTKKKK